MGLSAIEREIEQMLKDAGAVLIQKEPHRKYRFPNGRNFIMSATPGDHRVMLNRRASLRRFLRGANGTIR